MASNLVIWETVQRSLEGNLSVFINWGRVEDEHMFASALSFWGYCIIRHSLRYYRHSGLVIYKSKLLAPSVLMPCYYRILQSPTKEQVKTCPFWDRRAVSFWLCRPFGAHKCGSMIYPGLAPWAVQEYRPYRAYPCFCYPSIILLFWCACLASLFRMVSAGTKIFFRKVLRISK